MCTCRDCGRGEEEAAKEGAGEPVVCWTRSQVKKEISQEEISQLRQMLLKVLKKMRTKFNSSPTNTEIIPFVDKSSFEMVVVKNKTKQTKPN